MERHLGDVKLHETAAEVDSGISLFFFDTLVFPISPVLVAAFSL